MEEVTQRLEVLIAEDNVDELSNIINANANLKYTFDIIITSHQKQPLLLFAVQENSQKVLEYLLSQDFVNKKVCNQRGENIYHIIMCEMSDGAEELFKLMERKIGLFRLYNNFIDCFFRACKKNNLFIVQKMHRLLENLQVDFTNIKKNANRFAIMNKDIEVIKYIISIYGMQLDDNFILETIRYSILDFVVYLLNAYLCQSIPSHLHHHFNIFQFSNQLPNNNNNNNNNLNNKNNVNNNNNNDGDKKNNNDNDENKLAEEEEINYLKIVEKNYKKLLDIEITNGRRYWQEDNVKINGKKIWHKVCENENLIVVQFIFSLKEIPKFNEEGIACLENSNIKVIKFLHKIFPHFLQSKINNKMLILNAAIRILKNGKLNNEDKLNILHYFYLNGVDFRYILQEANISDENIKQYLKVISQELDLNIEQEDDEGNEYREIDSGADEQSKRVNEWKNRFYSPFLKMIQPIQEQLMQN